VRTSLMANGAWSNSLLLQAALCGGTTYSPPTRARSLNALVNSYLCADGRGLYLAMVQETVEWERFTSAIGAPELRDDPRFRDIPSRRANAPALVAVLDPIFASRPLAHWRAELDRHTVTFGIIARVDDLPDDPQLNANGVFRAMTGPGIRDGLRTVDSPIHLDGAPKREPTRAPELGEHGREILASLGYDAARIDSLVASGVLKE
jgi:formyl-CoA transferase